MVGYLLTKYLSATSACATESTSAQTTLVVGFSWCQRVAASSKTGLSLREKGHQSAQKATNTT